MARLPRDRDPALADSPTEGDGAHDPQGSSRGLRHHHRTPIGFQLGVPRPRHNNSSGGRLGAGPLYFTTNEGQLDPEVDYSLTGSDKTIYFTEKGVTFALSEPQCSAASLDPSAVAPRAAADTESQASGRWAVKLDFPDAQEVSPRGETKSETLVSYFTGSAADWKTALPTYTSILYPELWPGIGLRYTESQHELKQEFVLEPGANPARIRLAYWGADVNLGENGDLVVTTPVASFTDSAPIAFQEAKGRQISVEVSCTLEPSAEGSPERSVYGFRLGD